MRASAVNARPCGSSGVSAGGTRQRGCAERRGRMSGLTGAECLAIQRRKSGRASLPARRAATPSSIAAGTAARRLATLTPRLPRRTAHSRPTSSSLARAARPPSRLSFLLLAPPVPTASRPALRHARRSSTAATPAAKPATTDPALPAAKPSLSSAAAARPRQPVSAASPTLRRALTPTRAKSSRPTSSSARGCAKRRSGAGGISAGGRAVRLRTRRR